MGDEEREEDAEESSRPPLTRAAPATVAPPLPLRVAGGDDATAAF